MAVAGNNKPAEIVLPAAIKDLLPEAYSYYGVSYQVKPSFSNEPRFICTFRVSINSKEEVKYWLKKFQEISYTTWRVRKTFPEYSDQLIYKYVEMNKEKDNDWFRLESNKDGTRWFGKCWHIHELLKYEFDVEFDIPVTYPTTAPEIALPELDGKTAKMYRGGKICMTDHFKPLWARNVPKFGIAHAFALGLGPWLAVEVPEMISRGVIEHKQSKD